MPPWRANSFSGPSHPGVAGLDILHKLKKGSSYPTGSVPDPDSTRSVVNWPPLGFGSVIQEKFNIYGRFIICMR
jgi:hypothetical protein